MHRSILLMIVATLLGLVGVATSADSPTGERAADAVAVADRGPRHESREDMEKQVLAFLNEHHPELVQVLSNLHSNLPHEYDRAIRDLARVRQRLSELAAGDPQRHQLDLQAWVVQSRIHLAVARLAMGDSPALREELRGLLQQQVDLKLQSLRYERERQAERLRKMDEQIERLSQNTNEQVAKQMAALTKSSEAMAAKIRETRGRAKKGSAGPVEGRPKEPLKKPGAGGME